MVPALMLDTSRPLFRLRSLFLCAVAAIVLFGGCASTGNPRDPLEPLNRAIYTFNDGVDHMFVKPAAEIYRAVLPPIVRTGISNFFSNLNDVLVALNNLLQGKITQAGIDVARIFVNSTVGVLGFIDVATEIGLEKHYEDFGQTLGYWGLGDGPYIVLPFLGPSSVRDTAGWVGDVYTWPGTYVDPNRDRNALIALRFVSGRSELLEASKIIETAALDPYEFVRDAYLQRRRTQVHDGNPPDDDAMERNGKPLTKNAPPPAVPVAAESDRGAIIVSGDSLPTPAALEARGRAAQAAPAASRPALFDGDESRKKQKVVRVWLPFGSN